MLDQHKTNTKRKAEVVVGDSKYGTIDNYLECYARGVAVHTSDLKDNQDRGKRRTGIYPRSMFA